MAVKIIILIALMAGTAFGYDPVSSYSVTNNRELLNPEVSFTGQVGRLMRVTTYVKNGDATPYDLGTNSVRAWITQADSGTNQTVTATIVSAANGIVQYQWSPTLDGNNSAKLVAYAMANTVTVAQIAEHYVTVTPANVSISVTTTQNFSGATFNVTNHYNYSVTGATNLVTVGGVTGAIGASTLWLTGATVQAGSIGGVLVSNVGVAYYVSATNGGGGGSFTNVIVNGANNAINSTLSLVDPDATASAAGGTVTVTRANLSTRIAWRCAYTGNFYNVEYMTDSVWYKVNITSELYDAQNLRNDDSTFTLSNGIWRFSYVGVDGSTSREASPFSLRVVQNSTAELYNISGTYVYSWFTNSSQSANGMNGYGAGYYQGDVRAGLVCYAEARVNSGLIYTNCELQFMKHGGGYTEVGPIAVECMYTPLGGSGP